MNKILPLVFIAFLQLTCVLSISAQYINYNQKSTLDPPIITWAPSHLIKAVFPGHFQIVPLSIGNTGEEDLIFDFQYYSELYQFVPSPYSYCNGSGGCTEYISKVMIGEINNSSNCSGYADYTSIGAHFQKNTSMPITVTIGYAYSTDITGVWIDFDHSSTFDNEEFTQLSGYSPATGMINIPDDALMGPTTMRIRLQDGGTLQPCGVTTFGEVEDYTVTIIKNTFISDIFPTHDTVNSGILRNVDVIFSATGNFMQPGIYYDTIDLICNDPMHPLVRIPAELHITSPAYLHGKIVDYITDQPLSGVTISADGILTMSNDTGYYSISVAGGMDKEIVFSRPGFENMYITVNIPADDTLTQTDTMQRIAYPPSCAHAVVDSADTQCNISWCPPMITNLFAYDDFSADNFTAWENAGNMYAVRFTPDSYPATLKGFQIMFGDGVTPFGGSSIGQLVNIYIYDDDGPDGMPGTLIDSMITATYNTPWLMEYGLQTQITGGDFYIAMRQMTDAPDCVPLGVDTIAPFDGRSYSKNVTDGEDWIQLNDRNFLIHAFIESPDDSADYYHHYRAWRLSGFNPDDPLPGTACYTLLNSNATSTSYMDGGTTWANLAAGWYAYCIQAVAINGNVSDPVYTDIVAHKLYADASINVLSGCDTLPAEGITVTLSGADYPHATHVAQTDAAGKAFFDNMIMGHYLMSISGTGFNTFADSVNIQADYNTEILLDVSSAKPENLTIDDHSLIATWELPLFDAPGANESSPLLSCAVYLDGDLLGETQEMNWNFSGNDLLYGQTYTAEVSAHYCTGYSETDTVSFTNHYLPPPLNFTLDTICTINYALANLAWQLPDTTGTFCLLTAYALYKNDTLLAEISADSLHFTDTLFDQTAVCYKISALYDLTVFGFPAQTGESIITGPECSGIVMGISLPFGENWSMGFEGNEWEHGENWVIQNSKSDNEASARFVSQPQMQNYSSPLQSHWINAVMPDNEMPYDLYLYFDLTLLNKNQTNDEMLAVEILDDSTWVQVKEYTNMFSFSIKPERLNISTLAKNHMFKVRFKAEGLNSADIFYWDVDNIVLRAELTGVTPANLTATAYGNEGNDVQLHWNSPHLDGDSAEEQADHRSGNFFENDDVENIKASTPEMLGYKIYRRGYMLPGEAGGLWSLLATVTDTAYIDENLNNNSDNCYQYYVASLFAQGESSPSNIAEACIYVNNKMTSESGILVYPNPASEFVIVKMNESNEILSIINSLGIEIQRINIRGNEELSLYLKNYNSGTYLLQFTSETGQTEIVKLIIQK